MFRSVHFFETLRRHFYEPTLAQLAHFFPRCHLGNIFRRRHLVNMFKRQHLRNPAGLLPWQQQRQPTTPTSRQQSPKTGQPQNACQKSHDASKLPLRGPPAGRREPHDGLQAGLQGLKTPRHYDVQKQQTPLFQAPPKVTEKNDSCALLND